jgi:hypothetical protein
MRLSNARQGLLLAGLLFLLFPVCLSAQSLAGYGAIEGTVLDSSRAIVPNAVVTVSNPSLGVERKITTSDSGQFSASSLPPADGYKVSVQASGFAVHEVKEISLHVGQVITVPVTLSVSLENQTISVTDTAAVIDPIRSGVSSLVDQQVIADLPINGRRVDQFSLLSPGVTTDGNNGEVSFHGVPNGNSYVQDGVDVTSQWFLANSGTNANIIAILSSISQDAVQEFRVQTSGYDAEFGRAAGGVVNTLTKSGTNSVHGSGFWFFRNRTLNAIDPFAKLNGVPYNPPEYRHQFGGSVGGPIVKDKLFFFANTEMTRRHYPLVSSIVNPSILVTGDPNHSFAPGVCTASATQCAAAQAYFGRFFQKVNRSLSQTAGFLKLDWRPSAKNNLTANFNIVNFSAPDGLVSTIAPTDGSGVGTNGTLSTHVRNGRLSDTYVISNSMINEFRFGYNKDRRAQDLDVALAPPNGLRSQLIVAGQSNLGVSQNQLPNVQPTEDRFQFVDVVSQTLSKHALKYGAEISFTRDVENAVFNGPGAYTYGTVTAFALDLTPTPGDPLAGKHWQNFTQAIGSPVTKIKMRDYNFFIQDQWKIARQLTLSLGLRYEYGQFTQPPLNPDYPQTGKINQPMDNFAPRVGVAYSLNNDRTVIRGGFGIFYSRLPAASIMRLQQLGGVVRKSFTLSSSNPAQFAVGPVFPNRLTTAVNQLVNVGFVASDLATPNTMQSSVGIEQSLGKRMNFSISYVMSRGRKFLQRSDLNLGPSVCCDNYSIVDASGAQVGTYTTPVYLLANRVDPRYARVLQIDNGGYLWYDAMAFEYHWRGSRWVQANASYTWAHSIDLAQGTASQNYYFTDQGDTYFNGIDTINGRSGYSYEKGSSLLDQRHRAVISAIGSLPRHTFASSFADIALNGWQLSLIETLATAQKVNPTLTVGSADPRVAFTAPTLSGVGGQSPGGTRVPFKPTASLPLGSIAKMDARLTKSFILRGESRLELSFEATNLFNTIYYTAVSQTMYRSTWSTATNSGTIAPVSGTGVGTASGGFPDGTNARRAQVSVRFSF